LLKNSSFIFRLQDQKLLEKFVENQYFISFYKLRLVFLFRIPFLKWCSGYNPALRKITIGDSGWV